jgi:predicted DNA-binding transcriptional regulator AlpA
MEKLLTVKELSEILNVPKGTIYYHSTKPDFPLLKIGKHNRYYLSEVLSYFGVANEVDIQNNVLRNCSLKTEYLDMGRTKSKEG